MTVTDQCAICGPALPSDLDAILKAGHLTRRHGHRLHLVLTGTSWRFWWAVSKKEIEPELRRRRNGQGVHLLEIRPARYDDVVRCHEAGGVR